MKKMQPNKRITFFILLFFFAISSNILNQYPDYKVSIGGHTDSNGNAEFNQRLSEKRAAACLEYLARKGIAKSRMSSIGYGETQPVANNKYESGRKENRRVVFNLFL